MDSETEILLRRARALSEDQRRELVRELMLSLAPESGAQEIRESLRPYDAERIPSPDSQPKPWASLSELRSQLGIATLSSNPVIDMREDERF